MSNTPSPTELIAKLRKPDAWSAHIHGDGSFSTVEEAAPFEAADRLESLLSECERAWSAYRIAHDQAMSNGEALANERADRAKLEERVSYLALRVVSLRRHGLRCKCGECVELDADINRNTDRGDPS